MQPTGWPWAARQKDSSYAITGRVRAASRWGAIEAAEREPSAAPELNAAPEPGAIPDGLQAQAVIPGVLPVPAVTRAVPPEPHATPLQGVTQDERQGLHAFQDVPVEPALQLTWSPACFPAGPRVHCGLLLDALLNVLLQPAHEPHHGPQDERRRRSAAPQLRSPDAHGWR